MSEQVLELKKQIVEEIKTKIQDAKSVVLVDYKGLTVYQDTEFRAKLRDAGVEYKVLKNRLVKIAFNELGYTDFDEALNGPTAVAFSTKDAVAAARIVVEAGKNYGKVSAKCGLMDGAYLDEAAVKTIAALPSKEVLIAKMLGSMLSPISKLAYVLNAISEQKAQA
jgi:Ribosomal protein L10